MSYPFKQAACYTPGRSDMIDMIVIHFTAAATLGGTVDWFSNPASRASSHYIGGRDGSIVQMVKESDTAWHAGVSEWNGQEYCNRFSIGIELVNWGNLKLVDGKYRCWPDEWQREYDASKYGQPVKVGDWWWAPYTEEQIQACIQLLKDLRARYPEITEDRIVGHKDVAPNRKLDPGPLFPMDRLREESRPEPLTLPDEHYADNPTSNDYLSKPLTRMANISWIGRLLEYFRTRR